MSNGNALWTGGAHRQHTGAFVLVGAVMALALILRLFHIERESLWIDEGYSIWFARQPYGDLVGDIAKTEFNPPLYYLMLHVWVDLLGESVLSIRLLSSLINVATIPLVYLAARWSVPERDARVTGLLAATLFALCFAQIQYSHDARAYALLVLGFSVVVAASVRIIRDLAAMTGMPGDRPAQWPWLMLGFGAALTLWSHYSSLLLLVVAGLAHVAIWIGPGRGRIAILGLYLRSALVFLLLATPVLWLFVAYAMPGSNDFWIKPPSLPDMLDATSTIFGAAFSLPSWRSDLLLRLAIFAPWPVLGLAYGLFRGDKHVRTSAALLFALSLGAFALYLAVTYVARPVFLQRVVLPTQLGWIVLCAMAPLVFPAGRLRHAASALLVVFFSAGAIGYHEARPEITRKEPWGKTAALVAQHSPEGATVFTSGSGEVIIGYYLDRLGRSDIELVPVSGSLSIPEVRQPFEPGAGYYSPPLTAEGAARMKARMSAGDGVYWLVLRNPDGRALEPYKAVFDEFGSPGPVCDHFMPGPVGVYRVPQRRYEPCGPSPTGERP